MARFSGDVLGAFRSIFRTEDGAQAPSAIETTAPITTVADVSRIAQQGQFLRGSLAVSHAGATTERDSVTWRQLLSTASPPFDPNQVDVWLMDLACLVDSATSGAWSLAVPGIIGGNAPPLLQSVNRAFALGYFTTVLAEVIAGQGVACARGSGFIVRPQRMRPDNDAAGLYLVSVSTGAVTSVRLMYSIAVVPRGGTPPGVA